MPIENGPFTSGKDEHILLQIWGMLAAIPREEHIMTEMGLSRQRYGIILPSPGTFSEKSLKKPARIRLIRSDPRPMVCEKTVAAWISNDELGQLMQLGTPEFSVK